MDTTGKLLDMKCLVLCGNAGAGKDTVANYVRDYLGESDIGSVKFSKSLKLACAAIYHWDYNMLDFWEYKEECDPVQGVPRRQLLKQWGMIGREVDPNTWVDSALAEAKANALYHQAFIATDCRFANEQEGLEYTFGSTLFVRLHKRELSKRCPEITQSCHPSEDLSDLTFNMEFTVETGDFDELRRIARYLAEGFFHDLR